MQQQAVFIASEQYRRHRYANLHPLNIPRVSLTLDLIKAAEAIEEAEILESPQATPEQLGWFHHPAYIEAMQESEAAGKVLPEFRKPFNLGNFENPYFPNFYTTPAVAAGGSILAAEQVLQGKMAFSPAGGMHHAMPAQAQGFCFFNDPVLAIKRLRQAGKTVLYMDIDAHHGDGVEAAFARDVGVATFSIHMDTAYAYPFKGGNIADTGPLNNTFNLPLPKGCNDSEYDYVFSRLWPRILETVGPDVIVLQAGTDILLPDPLGKFNISTQQFLKTVTDIKNTAPDGALVVLGGGGYHPLTLARCWLGVWCVLSERTLPLVFNRASQAVLRSVDWDEDEDAEYFARLFESPLDESQAGAIRNDVKQRAQEMLAQHPALRAGMRQVSMQ